jgi:hypothetical protein
MIEAFPLHWPEGFERSTVKRPSQFKVTLAQARDGVLNELERLKGQNTIISSNIPLKKNGDMYATQMPVDGDHGVAVYFTWRGDPVVLACDAYPSIRENLRAVQKSIEAIRGLDRWGASDILKRTFMGFKALPQNAGPSSMPWWEILHVSQNTPEAIVTAAYRSLAKQYHPDNNVTGDREKFELITKAYEQASIK